MLITPAPAVAAVQTFIDERAASGVQAHVFGNRTSGAGGIKRTLRSPVHATEAQALPSTFSRAFLNTSARSAGIQ